MPDEQFSRAFLVGVEIVLHHEVGNYFSDRPRAFTDDVDDPGGATNWGVSLRWLRSIGDFDGDGALDGDLDHDGDVDWQDIRMMTREDAIALYHTHWWRAHHYDRISEPHIAWKLFDLGVNMGPITAGKIVQVAVNRCGANLLVDGQIGPLSRLAIAGRPLRDVLPKIRAEAAAYYRRLRKPKFVKGWLNRAAW